MGNKCPACHGGGAQSGAVQLADGVTVPWFQVAAPDARDAGSPSLFLFGHALDGSAQEFHEPLDEAIQRTPSTAVPRTVVFDARGHGASAGWKGLGPAQYHWRSLGLDMLQVAVANGAEPGKKAILGGCSMGAMSALWAAMECPPLVQGLVLYNVPEIWEYRSGRIAQAQQQQQWRGDAATEKLLGAAITDLPPKEEVCARVHVPVLLVNCEEDPAHPAACAQALAALFGQNATLVIVRTKAELQRVFPEALGSWLSTARFRAAPTQIRDFPGAKAGWASIEPCWVWPVFNHDHAVQAMDFFHGPTVESERKVQSWQKVQALIFYKVPEIWMSNMVPHISPDHRLPGPQEISRLGIPVLVLGSRDELHYPAAAAEAFAAMLGPKAIVAIVNTKDELPGALNHLLPALQARLKEDRCCACNDPSHI